MPETLNLPEVELRQVGSPETDAGIPVMLTDKTMQERLQRVLARMQAEQLDEGLKPRRRLWGTRVKKFDGERWMVSVLEVETLGSRHRTKITVDSLRELEN